MGGKERSICGEKYLYANKETTIDACVESKLGV